MIQTPYNLNLTLKLDITDNIDLKIKSSPNTELYKEQSKELNKDFLDKNNIFLDDEINLFDNKLKSIILNMGIADTYFLVSNEESGFDLSIKITNNNRINKNNYSTYTLTNGIVGPFSINEKSELRNYVNFDFKNLVLQTIDEEINTIEEFISKWEKDKNMYEKNIPDIYFYGTIYNNSSDFLSYYYISKKYYNYSDIIKQTDFNFIITFFKKLLILLDNILSHNYILRNFCMFNLGFQKISPENFEIIFIRYTNKTILSLEDDFFKKFKVLKCYDKKCIGSLTPYYIIDDYYNIKNDWLIRLNKFYSLGLVEIILILFYNNDDNLTKVYDFIIGPSIFEGQLHYYHFYKRFNSNENIHNLNLTVNDLKLRFCDINPLFEYKLLSIIINLLNKDYDKILYPNNILNILKKMEESKDEFKIEYTSKTGVYNPQVDNYLKANYKKKLNILSDDNFNDNINNNNENNSENKNTNKDNTIENKEILEDVLTERIKIPMTKITYKLPDKNYYSKYIKYKLKYTNLKNNIK